MMKGSEERDALGFANARQITGLVRQLREVRLANGISVENVAADMEVDPSMIYRFEKGGTNFTAATISRYALAVGAVFELSAYAADLPLTQSQAS